MRADEQDRLIAEKRLHAIVTTGLPRRPTTPTPTPDTPTQGTPIPVTPIPAPAPPPPTAATAIPTTTAGPASASTPARPLTADPPTADRPPPSPTAKPPTSPSPAYDDYLTFGYPITHPQTSKPPRLNPYNQQPISPPPPPTAEHPHPAPNPPTLEPPNLPPTFEAFRATVATQLAPARPQTRALILLGVVAAVIAAFWLWRAQPLPEPLPVPTPNPAPSTQQQHPRTTPTPTAELIVHVTGKVRRPGVYTLPAGSRVTDALQSAGGPRPGADTSTVNLARRLTDGEQIAIGTPAAPNTPPPAAAPATTALVNINTATPDQLEQLPGVGEVLAQRIITFRDTHGGFQSVDQLREVSGIGPRTYAELKDKVQI
ncbi:helix-hairpin-helix domain-containing protein [Nonomuraea sp. NPDC050328]|uniref:helix-hairpin-helix domain-containing protein n=1 Tax=Nonomuraea sp. NPDC050328 TaxID=3364361 RepID=UPI0037BC01E0